MPAQPRELPRTGRRWIATLASCLCFMCASSVCPAEEPRWGVGMVLGGPVGVYGFTFQVFATPWLVFDAAVFAAPEVGSACVGFRLRPLRLGRVRPFVGGFASDAFAVDAETGASDTLAAVGGRAGLDLAVGTNGLLTFEVDLMHPLGDVGWWFDRRGDVLLWGGLGAAWVW